MRAVFRRNTIAILLFGLSLGLFVGLFISGCNRPAQPDEDEPMHDTFAPIDSDDRDLPDDPDDISDLDHSLDETDSILETDQSPEAGFRGVWVATVFGLDFPSQPNLTADAIMREIDYIVLRTAEIGLDAIMFQVRPTGDAFYESAIFPWSEWLSGTQGQGIPDFDPLAYFIEKSHANGIQLHAWLNPYRIIHTATDSSDPDTLSPDNPVRLNPELAVGWTSPDGNRGLFLDPGLPEARELIIDGIIELAENYNIDGIHIDDYFYPGRSFDDSSSFERYGGAMDIADWRRENVNTLIRDIQTAIRNINEEHDRNIRWGISPSAIWKNDSSDPLGKSVLSTFESYYLLYADSRRWVMEELVDYISPQIYWYTGFETADFKTILDWWIDLCRDSSVDLYIGHAAWREADDEQPPNWRGEMTRQLELVAHSEVPDGSVFYRFTSIRGAVGDSISDFFADEDENNALRREPVMILDTLTVGVPSGDITIRGTESSAPGFNIAGTSIPDVPLYMNGEEVSNRTIEGFFFVFAPLESGANEFIFSQDGQEDVIRVITRSASGGSGGGSSGGESGSGSAADITEITTPRYATVTSAASWLYPSNRLTGSGWMLEQGQRDLVTATSGNNFARLSCGMWIPLSAVTLRSESEFIENVLQNGVYRIGADFDALVWQADIFPAVYATYDGTTLRVQYGMHSKVPPLSIFSNLSETIFSTVSRGVSDGIPYHEFTVREDANLEGFFVEFGDGEFRLILMKRKALAHGDYPLTGITIVLDPGHGGDSPGALGPLGISMSEKDIVLINAFKLRDRLLALGATVHLTRTTDVDVSLEERVAISRRIRPDLFISLHINSVTETTNAENIRGFSVWYRNPNAADLSQTVLDIMHDIIPGTTRSRNINQANFYVCRPVWAPSILLEAGFIINIDDFVYLIDPIEQAAMADRTVEAILEYFSE